MKFQRKYDDYLTKELLTDLYIVKKLTIKEICKKMSVDNHTVYRYLDLHNLREDRKGHIKPGFKSNKLTAIKIIGQRKCGTYIWECQCDCGNVTKVDTAALKNNNVKSCGCISKGLKKPSLCNNRHFWRGFGEISGNKFSNIRCCAKNRNIDFNIKIEYIWGLFIQQNRKCALSNLDLDMKTNASLDRINSSLPYTHDNVWWIHKDINLIKSNLSVNEFKDWCYKVSNPIKTINENINQVICTSFWCDIIHNAKKRKINFNITIDYAEQLFKDQNGCCAITGEVINLPINNTSYRTRIHTASLDRIDNNIGYENNNIQWVNKIINQSRKYLKIEDYKKLCQLIT